MTVRPGIRSFPPSGSLSRHHRDAPTNRGSGGQLTAGGLESTSTPPDERSEKANGAGQVVSFRPVVRPSHSVLSRSESPTTTGVVDGSLVAHTSSLLRQVHSLLQQPFGKRWGSEMGKKSPTTTVRDDVANHTAASPVPVVDPSLSASSAAAAAAAIVVSVIESNCQKKVPSSTFRGKKDSGVCS